MCGKSESYVCDPQIKKYAKGVHIACVSQNGGVGTLPIAYLFWESDHASVKMGEIAKLFLPFQNAPGKCRRASSYQHPGSCIIPVNGSLLT